MLVSHTFVADKMDKDRPGLPAPDDNIEEVPSTSGVQERASEGDWENVLIEISDSSSEEEAEDAHLEPSQRGKKRKRVDDDAGGSAPAQHVPPPQLDHPGREAILYRFPLELRRFIQAIGAAATVSFPMAQVCDVCFCPSHNKVSDLLPLVSAPRHASHRPVFRIPDFKYRPVRNVCHGHSTGH